MYSTAGPTALLTFCPSLPADGAVESPAVTMQQVVVRSKPEETRRDWYVMLFAAELGSARRVERRGLIGAARWRRQCLGSMTMPRLYGLSR